MNFVLDDLLLIFRLKISVFTHVNNSSCISSLSLTQNTWLRSLPLNLHCWIVEWNSYWRAGSCNSRLCLNGLSSWLLAKIILESLDLRVEFRQVLTHLLTLAVELYSPAASYSSAWLASHSYRIDNLFDLVVLLGCLRSRLWDLFVICLMLWRSEWKLSKFLILCWLKVIHKSAKLRYPERGVVGVSRCAYVPYKFIVRHDREVWSSFPYKDRVQFCLEHVISWLKIIFIHRILFPEIVV